MSAEPLMATVSSRCRLLALSRFDDARGSLCVAEAGRQIPFALARAYWIFDIPSDEERARHAHRRQQEVLIAVRGSFVVHCDDGEASTRYALDSPEVGLLLPPMVFHHLDEFSADAICLVLSSGPYLPEEYVYDREEFDRLSARR